MPDINLFNHPLVGTPFGTVFDLCLILAAMAWLLSVVTREYSWVDRFWSICPIIYCLIVAASVDFDVPRLNLMLILVSLWGVRLTFNFARKGGFWKGGEDYRWGIVRERVGELRFQVINLLFIAFGQMLIIWLFLAPVHLAWLGRDTSLTWIDGISAALFLVFLVGETIADEQMWAFQQAKKQKIAAGEEITQPFIKTGLFAFCRHPNYFCDISLWWVFYLFGVAATGQWLNWSGLGFIILTLLFILTSKLVESISLERYPAYREYQESVPQLMPFTRIGCLKVRNDNGTELLS